MGGIEPGDEVRADGGVFLHETGSRLADKALGNLLCGCGGVLDGVDKGRKVGMGKELEAVADEEVSITMTP